MILKGIVTVVKHKPFCVSPLGLVEKRLPDNSVKFRLVWDASRHVNQYVKVPHVRLAHLDKAFEVNKEVEAALRCRVLLIKRLLFFWTF